MKAIWNKVKENLLLSILSVLLIALGAVFFVVMFADCPQWIFKRLGITRPEEPKYEALKFLGIGMGGLLIALQALMSYRRAKAMEDAVEKTEQGQQQDRLKNAIEHLGHKSDSVRLGGAYELFHLAKDIKELRQTVLDILCAHIRQTTGDEGYQKMHKSKPSEEVQSLLTLLFVQENEVFKDCHINLQGSWLNGADLREARLWKATLVGARLQEKTNLYRANLQRANLFEAHLEEAILYEAQLQNTVLQSARLQGANLYQAILQCADLDGAYLQASYLQEANMQGANLSYTRLQGATLSNARLQGAALTFTSLQGAILNQVRLEGTGEQVWSSSTSFADRLRMSIGKETDLYRVLFGGGIGQGGVDSLIKGLSNNRAMELRDSLRPHIGKPVSYQLPENSGAIIGSYTEEDAEKWIAEYKEAMFEVLEDES